MTRYAHLYAQTEEKLAKTEAALAKAAHDLEAYRRFIKSAGHVREFMLWWANDQGFNASVTATLEQIEEPRES